MLYHGPQTPLRLASSVKLATPQNLRRLTHRSFTKIHGIDVCRASISPTHKLAYTAELILKDSSHVLQPRLRQRYEPVITGRYDASQEGLWITFTSNPMHRVKVVRSWAKRRTIHAIIEELRVRGFDRNGRKINTKGLSEASRSQKGAPGSKVPDTLIGTVDIEVLSQNVETDYREVQRQAGLVADKILGICGRHQGQIKPRARGPSSGG